MERRHEGHPAAAILLLFSMFAFAFVFHVVTRPDATVAAYFNTQLAAYPSAAAAVSPLPAVIATRVVINRPAVLETRAAFMATAAPEEVQQPSLADAPRPAALMVTGHAPAAPLLSPIDPITPTLDNGGAVARAIGTTRSAVRSAFKKAF